MEKKDEITSSYQLGSPRKGLGNLNQECPADLGIRVTAGGNYWILD